MQLITREALKATLDANDDSKLVMVVGPWEFRARHIPGSLGFRRLLRPKQQILGVDIVGQVEASAAASPGSGPAARSMPTSSTGSWPASRCIAGSTVPA